METVRGNTLSVAFILTRYSLLATLYRICEKLAIFCTKTKGAAFYLKKGKRAKRK